MFSNYMAITDKTTLQFVFHYKQCKYDNEPKVDWKVDWHRRSPRESDCQLFPSGIIYNLYCLVTALLSKDLLLRCKCVRNKDLQNLPSCEINGRKWIAMLPIQACELLEQTKQKWIDQRYSLEIILMTSNFFVHPLNSPEFQMH